MDSIDLKLLHLLQTNASLTQRQLAEKVHISAATALRRINRLKQTGHIERQVAILSPARLGAYLQVIAEITLDRQDSAAQDEFDALVASVDAVQQCYRVSAGPDFILVITVADMAAYQALAHNVFSAHHNVRNVRAFFCTQRSKFTTQLPLPAP